MQRFLNKRERFGARCSVSLTKINILVLLKGYNSIPESVLGLSEGESCDFQG